jgi:hypothetical protein
METKVKKTQVKKDTWEMKDRRYLLKGMQPLSFILRSKSSNRKPLMYFDEEKGYERELRYATNQKSCFVDEQKGTCLLGHIIFNNGALVVPKENQALQKLLSLYHPLKDKKYTEFDSVKEAVDDLGYLELEIEALNSAKLMDVDQAEAILRVEIGSEVNNMSSKELKRDLLLFARNSPILNLASDQRSFSWASNGRKLMNVPFDENPYSALAAWFKTDEGVEVYKSIKKKLK